jgi:NDP-sugar pyrophosphorylase family protein
MVSYVNQLPIGLMKHMSILPVHPDNMRVSKLFEPGFTLSWKYLSELEWPWEALPLISDYITGIGVTLDESDYEVRPGDIWIHRSASIAPTAFIGSRVIIGAETEVRHCAYIRGPALIGDGAVVGNSTEIKNSILFDKVQVPHYNYVGDSILGYKSHLGAGAITSNVKSDSSLVSVVCGDARIETGIKKFGAILGDYAEVGCNAVLNPGSVIGPRTTVYPLSMVRGYIPADSIYKRQGEVAEKRD